MNKEQKLERTIVTLAKITNISEKQKQQLIKKYSNMSDNEIIKDLSTNIYNIIGSDSTYYDYALTTVRNYSPQLCPKLTEMKQILAKMFSNQIEGNMPLEQNHQLVIDSLTRFCTLFNQNQIDYYIVGALPCFLKTNQPLFRYHDDIDIMINEDDLPKISEILKQTNYEFHDDRFPSLSRFHEMKINKPPHTVLAQNKDNEFHLGFFTFRREPDHSITMREYSHRLEDNRVVVDIIERLSTPIATSLRYDENPTTYNGVNFKTSTIESVYNLKNYTRRPKDLTDMKKLEPYLDQNKLDLLQQHKNQEIIIPDIAYPGK